MKQKYFGPNKKMNFFERHIYRHKKVTLIEHDCEVEYIARSSVSEYAIPAVLICISIIIAVICFLLSIFV